MGMRFRKSFKIAPGVKLNLSKRGIGVSAGVKGARVSLNSKGRVTKSVGIPGTGISYVSSSKLGASKKEGNRQENLCQGIHCICRRESFRRYHPHAACFR